MKANLIVIKGRGPKHHKTKEPERSILNRLFDLREELEELLGRDDGLYTLVDCAVAAANIREERGMIPRQQYEEDPPLSF